MKKFLIAAVLLFTFFSSFSQDDELGIVPVHEIQGTGATSRYLGLKVVVRGVVTAEFSGKTKLNGFFIQELNEDKDPETSEGIFIYDPKGMFNGKIGNIIEVSGKVAEFVSNKSSSTQITDLSSIHIIDKGKKLPQPKTITLPESNLERFEGMLVKVNGPLYVTELYQLGRFGQLTLSISDSLNQPKTDGRLDQFTQFNLPDTQAHINYLKETQKRTLIIDDGSGVQNPEHIPFGREKRPFDMFHAIRAGDKTKEVIGILDERFGDYRIHPTETINFIPSNKRTQKPPRMPKSGTTIIASFNVLNYFNGDGKGGGFPTERGAQSYDEFIRQKMKTIHVLKDAKADIISLMEVENNGFDENSAIADITDALNSSYGGKRDYGFVQVENTGADVITSAIVYDKNKVKPIGKAVSIPDEYGYGSFDIALRKPIIQTFRDKKTKAEFTLVSVHFKSKGYLVPGEGNKDKNDGQGQNNEVRVQQSKDLLSWLATNPTETGNKDYILVGDFNAYDKEDPLAYLRENGFQSSLPPHSYSFVYNGYWGSLDHAFLSPWLSGQLSKAAKWHINADEARILDYSTQFKTKEQIESFYDTSVFRSSDHDPILLSFKFKKKTDK